MGEKACEIFFLYICPTLFLIALACLIIISLMEKWDKHKHNRRIKYDKEGRVIQKR